MGIDMVTMSRKKIHLYKRNSVNIFFFISETSAITKEGIGITKEGIEPFQLRDAFGLGQYTQCWKETNVIIYPPGIIQYSSF